MSYDERRYSFGAPPKPKPKPSPVTVPNRPGATSVGGMFRVPPKPPVVRPPVNYTGKPSASTMDRRLIGLQLQQAAAGMPLAPLTPSAPAPRPTPTGGGTSGGGGRGGGGGGAAVPPGLTAEQINEAIRLMTEAATAAQGRIGELYAGAGSRLGDMAGQYSAAQEMLGRGGARTLGAFGVADQQMNPLGMSAGDYLTSQQGLLTGLSADQQARLEQQKAAYALILGDLLKAGVTQ